MLIKISNHLIESRNTDPDFYNCLNMIMLSYKEGQHIIVIEPKKVRLLLDDELVDSQIKKLLAYYYNHAAKQSLGYLKYFNCVTRIVHPDLQSSIYSDIVSRTEYRDICSSYFVNSINIQQTIILGEDHNDSIIYELLGNFYVRKNHVEFIKIRCENQSGGGNNTHKSFKNIYNSSQRFCICFLDSDIKAPGLSIGDTAKRLVQFFYKNFCSNIKCHYFILNPILELENIFPIQFYVDTYGGDVNKSNIHTFIIPLADDIKCYFDYKNGILCNNIQSDSLYSVYWRNLLSVNHYTECDTYVDNGNKCCTNMKIIRGYGTTIAEDFIQYCNEDNVVELISSSEDYIQQQWNNIGREVANWCCGESKKIAI